MKQEFNPKNRDLLSQHQRRTAIIEMSPASAHFDSAVQGGDAVWEGLRLYRGRIFKLHPALGTACATRRLAMAFSAYSATHEDDHQPRFVRRLAANQMTDGVHIRLTLSRGRKIY